MHRFGCTAQAHCIAGDHGNRAEQGHAGPVELTERQAAPDHAEINQ
jgi:hypothetical protein